MSWTVGFRREPQRIWRHTFYFATREEAEGCKAMWERNEKEDPPERAVLGVDYPVNATFAFDPKTHMGIITTLEERGDE